MDVRADSHLHSRHSFDSQAPLADQCRAALSRGLGEVCFTEHFSLDPLAPTYGHMDWAAYRREFEACREAFEGRLAVYWGVEVCEPHLLAPAYAALFSRLPLDGVLGSVHNVGHRKLRRLVQEEGPDRAAALYFGEVLAMVEGGRMEVAAHLDLVKRYMGTPLAPAQLEANRPVLEAILSRVVQRGLALEVNTSTLEKLGEPMPSPWILRLYRQLGGWRVTLGSDAHQPERVGQGLAAAAALARELGFPGVCTCRGRQLVFHPF